MLLWHLVSNEAAASLCVSLSCMLEPLPFCGAETVTTSSQAYWALLGKGLAYLSFELLQSISGH